MARDPHAAEGAVQAYQTLSPAERAGWIAQVERCTASDRAGLGRAVLALFGAEDDPVRKQRLFACAAEAPYALGRQVPGERCWRLVRPLSCELASVATVLLDEHGQVLDARYSPLSPIGLDDGYRGVALSDAVAELAHAVVREPSKLRPVLLPFLELFSVQPIGWAEAG